MKNKPGNQGDKGTDKGGNKKRVPETTVHSMFPKQQVANALKDARDQYHRMSSTGTDWNT